MNTLREAIEVLQALERGDTIQFENFGESGSYWANCPKYFDVGSTLPMFHLFRYRVKPK
jgi:hypothetical protein